MTNSSFLGGERAARHAQSKAIDALGPSDSSDSSDSDPLGTGEPASGKGARVKTQPSKPAAALTDPMDVASKTR
jgi:hypothetical protein